MANNAKELRGQLRQVSKELLPQLITHELFEALRKEMKEELEKLRKDVITTLKAMDDRSKDTQSFVMREVLAASNNSPIAPTEPKAE